MNDPESSDTGQLNSSERQRLQHLYTLHRDHIYSDCCYASGDADASAEIVNETFLRLMKQPREPDNVRNWLFITARNLLFTRLRRSKHERTVTAREPIFNRTELSAEQRLFLQQMLEILSVEERELLLLREYVGLSMSELAESSGITIEAIRVRLFRIRKKLRSRIEDAI